MARIKVWRVFLGLAASGVLAACVETSGSSEGGATAPAGTAGRVRPGEEVQAPEVFHASESALWDGRPSLGGIWVASPDAVDPERVVMVNPATGMTVKGALFRRERDNPGPRLQLSSDAAEALGVLAGAPTVIEVTALRKLEVEEAAAPPEAPAAEPVAEPTAAEAPAEGDKEAAAVAAAALDAVGAGETASAAEATDPATDAAGATAEEPAKPMTWKEKRAAAKAERDAKKAAKAAAKAAAEAAAAGEALTGAEAPVTPGAVTGGEIASAPLDARSPEATEAADTATKPAAAPEAAAAADAQPAATGGAGRTIQIASFSKEDNAKRAVEALSKVDIQAQAKKIEKDGKVYWGVVATGDAALLKKIKDAGFADAYFLN